MNNKLADDAQKIPLIKDILKEEELKEERIKLLQDPTIKKELLNQYEVFEKDEDGKPTGKTNCSRLAKLLLNNDNHYYLVTKDNQEIFSFNGSYYEPNGEALIKERVQYYLDDINGLEYIKKEVVGYIRNHAYVDRETLNPPLNLINFKNGIYDFETKTFTQHSPEYYFLGEIPVNYDPNVKYEKWEKFIDDITYPEDKKFIQELCGYLLYRKYRWAILVILLGHGRNGKTTFINVLTFVLGKENMGHITLYMLECNRFASSHLYKKFANLCADPHEHEIKDTALIKQLTGCDAIFAEEKHKPGFHFESYAKLIFAYNILPEIKDKTLAMSERLAVIEFPNEFKKDNPECDLYMFEKLTTDEEKTGIINWMLEGLERLLKNNNFTPYRDFNNILEYKKKCQDPVYLFINSCLEYDHNVVTKKKVVYLEYKKFCEKNKLPILNDVWLSRKLKQFFPSEWKIEEGQEKETTWMGLKIKENIDDTPTSSFIPREEKEKHIQDRIDKEGE